MDTPLAVVRAHVSNTYIDIYCFCGKHTTVGDVGVYYVQCGACGRLFKLDWNVQLNPITYAEIKAYFEQFHLPVNNEAIKISKLENE